MKNLLKKLIQAQSTEQTGELAAVTVLSEYLAANDIQSRIDKWDNSRANLTAHIKSTLQKPALLFSAHLDVVPPGDEPWQIDPFSGTEENGKIHGRGSTDMKGGIAATAAAIAEAVKETGPLKGDLILAATAGEESDSCGTKRFIENQSADLPELAGVIIPEPTDFNIVTAHRGMCWLEVTTKGKSAHGSMPHLGINAVTHMTSVIERLKDYMIPHQHHPLLGDCSMSINQISGGSAVNIVPDLCSIKIDIRILPAQNHRAIIDDIEKILSQLKKDIPQLDAQVKLIRKMDALETDTNSEFVKSICQIAAVDKSIAVGFTTDGPFFAALDAPVAIFGPGDSSLCHQPNEYIDFANVEKAKQLYKEIIRKFLT